MVDLNSFPQAIQDVVQERTRQLTKEGWTYAHDDQHTSGSMAEAAAVYALSSVGYRHIWLLENFWKWSKEWFKPKTPRQDLVRAGALIIAEIERLDRIEARKAQPPTKPAE